MEKALQSISDVHLSNVINGSDAIDNVIDVALRKKKDATFGLHTFEDRNRLMKKSEMVQMMQL